MILPVFLYLSILLSGLVAWFLLKQYRNKILYFLIFFAIFVGFRMFGFPGN